MAVTKNVRSAKSAVSKSRKAAKPVAKRKSKTIRHGPGVLTKALGLEGWEKLEPVILAALASEEPLLLVGRHGAAKSFLLERLAEALELEFRCYNASLLNFDDLVGFPIPTEDKQSLRYIRDLIFREVKFGESVQSRQWFYICDLVAEQYEFGEAFQIRQWGKVRDLVFWEVELG